MYQGPDAVQLWMDAIRSEWEEFEVRLDEVLHDGEDVLVIAELLRGRDRESGAEPTMRAKRRVLPHVWEFETNITTQADPERVWTTWTDVERWPRWHPGIAQASLESPFAEGARGSSRAPGGPRSELRIGPVEPGRNFVSETILPFTRLRFEHQIEPAEGGGTTITYGVEMSGPATPLLRRIIGPRFEQRMPEALRGLAELAARR